MSSMSRVHYMDNLRAFAMLLGVLFHAALAYGPMLSQVWPTAAHENSIAMDVFAYFSHTFRMPLFFILAGFFAALLTKKYGSVGMIKNRLSRVTLPFVIFLPVVIASYVIIFGWAIENINNKSSMLQMMSFMAQNPDAPSPPLTTTHLWFLYNLTFFYLLTLIIVKWSKWDWGSQVFKSPLTFILVAPMLLVPALVTQHAPIPAPEQFMPQLWSFGFYGLFYLLGWGLYQYPAFIEKLSPYRWFMLIAGVVAYVVFFRLMPSSISMEDSLALMSPPDFSLRQLGIAALEVYVGVYMSLCLLVWGQRYADVRHSLVKFIADSSYWIYIIHLPVLWFIQFKLLDTKFSMLTQFAMSSLGTLFIGLLTYVVFVKWTPIGWLLNGRRAAPKSE
ncbi:hypothetical protein EYS14_06090 [Alteromonadaceae bacterium M269]|nr:hypothetical protein EYS14_06090 [Alteromonadaceae bacterium M269]